MNERRLVELPSGAKLRIQIAPFAVAKKLYQVVAKEAKGIEYDHNKTEVGTVVKDLVLSAFSSEEIDAALWACLTSCTYDGSGKELRVDQHTFESIDARQDYIKACIEVAKDNIGPFAKSLFADFNEIMQIVDPGSSLI